MSPPNNHNHNHHNNNSNHSNEEWKILVRQLDYSTTQNTVQHYFTQFGHVREVTMKVNDRGRSKGFCFVVFGDSRTVARVLEQGNHVIDNKQVQVIRAGCMDSSNKTCKLFCGGLPHGLSEDRLRQYFATFGEISSFEFIYDKDTATRKHFCFIIFVDAEAVERIVEGKLPPHSVIHHIGKYRVECKKKFDENHPIQRRIKQQKRSENCNHGGVNNFNNTNSNAMFIPPHHHQHHHQHHPQHHPGKRYPPLQGGAPLPLAPSQVTPAQTTYTVYTPNSQSVAPYYNTTYQTVPNVSYPLPNPSTSSYPHPAPSYPQTQASVNPSFALAQPPVNVSYPSGQHLANSSFTAVQPSANPSFVPVQPTASPAFSQAQPSAHPSFVTGQPPQNPSFTTVQPSANLTYTPAQPSTNASFTAAQPSANASYTPAQPSANASYTPAQPSANPPYGPTQTSLNPCYNLGTPTSMTYVANTTNTSNLNPTSALTSYAPTSTAPTYTPTSATTYLTSTSYTPPVAPAATTYTNYKAPTASPTTFSTTYRTLPKAVTTTYHDENRKGGGPMKRGSSSAPRGGYKPY